MIRHKLSVLLSLPKSFYFCLRSMPLRDAVKIPVLVSWRTVLRSTKGRVTFTGKKLRFGMARFGYGGSGTALHKPCCVENNGLMVFGEQINFGGGCEICTVNQNSVLSIGNNAHFAETHIVCKNRIEIGSDCFVSWGSQMMDSDFHAITVSGRRINEDAPISIGNKVWIGSRVTILKGTSIGSDNII